MNLLRNEQQESYDKQKSVILVKKRDFESKYTKDKKNIKVWDHCHYTGEYGDAAHNICNLKYSLIFLNGSIYNYHFIMKVENNCLVENNKKYITFSVAIKKEVTRIDKMKRNHKNPILQIYDIAQDLWQAHY